MRTQIGDYPNEISFNLIYVNVGNDVWSRHRNKKLRTYSSNVVQTLRRDQIVFGNGRTSILAY